MRKRTSNIWIKYSDDEFKKIVKEALTKKEIIEKCDVRYVGKNCDTLKKRIEELNIDISHLRKNYENMVLKNISNKRNLEDVMIKESDFSRGHLKERLLKEGILENECEICGQDGEWKGQSLIMILDHINGINNDHRRKNLRMVCPNCNSQLETHCGKHTRRKYYYCKCGKEINKHSKICVHCYSKKKRKVENRPSKDCLLKEVKKLGYCGTGRKYGVSDNAVRKWLK